MKHAIQAVISVCLIVVFFVGGMMLIPTQSTATPPAEIPLTVTLPPLPPVTIKLPGETVTIRPPPVTVTDQVPGPTVTKTIQPAPETTTITVAPETPTTTVTEPSETTTETVTETPSVSPSESGTGQDQPEGDRLDEDDPVLSVPDTVTEFVGLGLFSVLLIALLGFGGMAYGYYRGRKFEQVEEKKFLDQVLNNAVMRDKHR